MKTIRNVGWGPNLLTSVLYADRTYNFAPGVDVEVSDDVADYVHHMYGAHGLQIVVEPRSRLFFSDGVTPLLTECTDFLDFDALRKVHAAVGPPTHVIRGVKEIPGGPQQIDIEPITYKVEERDLGVFDPSLEAAVALATSPGQGEFTPEQVASRRPGGPLPVDPPDEVSSSPTEPEVSATNAMKLLGEDITAVESSTPPTLEAAVAGSIGISSEQLAGLEPPDPHKPHHKAKRK